MPGSIASTQPSSRRRKEAGTFNAEKTIPTGLSPSAQGWTAPAGLPWVAYPKMFLYPNGVVAFPPAWTIPRWGFDLF